MIEVVQVRELFNLSLSDEEILPHLQRADLDYEDITFSSSLDEKEAVGSKTLYYLAPHIWSKSSAKAREFDETLETFSDMEKFQEYWLNRAEGITKKYKNKDTDGDGEIDINSGGGISWRAI